MSYTINKTDGSTLVLGGLSDGQVDTSHTSLVLVGKNYAGYGQFLNENFVKLLENFASSSNPANPLRGQLWWDTTNNILKVYSGVSWKISTGATSAPYTSPPGDLSTLGGDLWFDTTNSQLKVYSGSAWVTVGPQSTPATGDTGSFPALMTDTSAGTHVVIQFKINGIVYAIFSKDTFSSALTGFATIRAGINFGSTASPTWGLSSQNTLALPNTLVERDSSSGIAVAGVSASSVTATSITADAFTGTFTGNLVGNVTATKITATGTISAPGITASSGFSGAVLTANQPNITGLGNVTNLATNGTTNIVGTATYNGVEIARTDVVLTTANQPNITGLGNVTNLATNGTTSITGFATYNGTEIATIAGITATFSAINNTPVGNVTPSTGAFTTLTVTGNITPTANLTSNIGSTSRWFNNIYGTAIHALYADLAERFEADSPMYPGTVVELGGPAEITTSNQDLSENVFGVISTNAAYLMNSRAGSNETHPPVAVQGRVPVRVIGRIRKGDRLVSAGNGLARAGARSEITTWNVIGRALENKLDDSEGIIEAVVKLNS